MGIAETKAQANLIPSEQPQSTPEATAQPQPAVDDSKRRRRKHGTSEDADITESPGEAVPTPLTQQQTQSVPLVPTVEAPPSNCVIRCPQACAFPGRCRRYIDENDNRLCDLGECL